MFGVLGCVLGVRVQGFRKVQGFASAVQLWVPTKTTRNVLWSSSFSPFLKKKKGSKQLNR